jgi:DNA uptake protein ComE-like DNA-binding protein
MTVPIDKNGVFSALKLRPVLIMIISTLTGSVITSCSKSIEDSPAYQAICHGAPLHTTEQLNQAMEDGYAVNRQFMCIEKISFAQMAESKAKWEAGNTPEAIAKRQAEFAEQQARNAEERARLRAAEESSKTVVPTIVLRNVDVNTASESDIANVITVGSDVAAQIVQERNKRRFANWVDLVNRVVGLSAAQPAAYASICGLNVNGKSLDGAPPNSTMAASLYEKYQSYRRN